MEHNSRTPPLPHRVVWLVNIDVGGNMLSQFSAMLTKSVAAYPIGLLQGAQAFHG